MMNAAIFSEEEESEDTVTVGQTDAHGMIPPRATRAQLELCALIKKERRRDKRASFSDTAMRWDSLA